MTADRRDLRRSPIAIPRAFWGVRYAAGRFPGADGVHGVEGGANCQLYAYAILRHFGFVIPDLRSSDLWSDTRHTRVSAEMQPFDLVLVHREPAAYGAHVGLCVGADLILHLSRDIDAPAIERLEEMQSREAYRCLIGCKTVLVRR